MRGLNKAFADFVPLQRKTRAQVVETAARGFVKDVVAITPPAGKGVQGAAAKKRGEATVQNDVLRIARVGDATRDGQRRDSTGRFLSAAERGLASAEELLAAHAASKTSVGRVKGAAAPLLVSPETLNRVIRLLQKRVGWLAAGWNAAATKLGVRLPAWVRRHGDSAGSATVTLSAFSLRLTVTNAVRYVGNVRAYERRIQFAINQQAAKLRRQMPALLQRSLKKAGF